MCLPIRCDDAVHVVLLEPTITVVGNGRLLDLLPLHLVTCNVTHLLQRPFQRPLRLLAGAVTSSYNKPSHNGLLATAIMTSCNGCHVLLQWPS